MQTIYKHWLVYLRELLEHKPLPSHTNMEDWQKMGLAQEISGGWVVTDLGVKIVQTADAMEELKSKGMKLSW